MRIEVEGRIGKDPKEIKEGVVVFSIARSESYKHKETGEWINKPAVWFDVFVRSKQYIKLIENLEIKKGSKVIVCGEFDIQEGTEKYPQPKMVIQILFKTDTITLLEI